MCLCFTFCEGYQGGAMWLWERCWPSSVGNKLVTAVAYLMAPCVLAVLRF